MEDSPELLRILTSLKLRTDQQPESEYNLKTFVPLLDFSALASPNTQIVYGRNGTGKTHLLKAFREYASEHYEKQKVLPVYIDCKALELGTVGAEIEVSYLIQRYYRLFVAKIVDALRDLAAEVLNPGLLDRILGKGDKDRLDRIRDSVDRLRAIFQFREVEERVKTIERKTEATTEVSSKASAALTIKLSAMEEPKLGAGGSLSEEDVSKRKQAVQFVYDGLAVIDYEHVRRQLEEIIRQCGATAIILLVDEWSSIDLTVQPLLAEMIRKTLSESKLIYLKIVALKYLTRTEALVKPPQRIGLQSGIDVFPLVDLDNLLCFDVAPQNVKDFLTKVAHKHCSAISDRVVKMEPAGFEAAICSDLFDGPAAYLEVVRASEGNPRDFLSLLASCCALRQSSKTKVSEKDATRTAVQYFTSAKEPTIRSNPRSGNFYKKLFERVVANKQKLFLLTAEKALADESVQELLAFRFIHLVNEKYTVLTENNLPREYAVFSMDYGKLASLKVQRKGEQLVQIMSYVAEKLGNVVGTPSFITGYIVGALQSDERLIKVAGTLVSTGTIEPATLDPETLVSQNVYDDLL
jgi:hypothetical protein